MWTKRPGGLQVLIHRLDFVFGKNCYQYHLDSHGHVEAARAIAKIISTKIKRRVLNGRLLLTKLALSSPRMEISSLGT